MSVHMNTTDLYPRMFYTLLPLSKAKRAIAGDGAITIITDRSHWIKTTNTMLTTPLHHTSTHSQKCLTSPERSKLQWEHKYYSTFPAIY